MSLHAGTQFSPLLTFLFIQLSAFANLSLADDSLTLAEAYQSALRINPTLADLQKSREIGEERITFQSGAWHPTVDAQAGFIVTDVAGGSGPSAKIGARQSLFRGFADSGRKKRQEYLNESLHHEIIQGQQDLLKRVIESYYEVQMLRTDIHWLSEMNPIFEKRIQEIQARVRVGRSRNTELLAAQASFFQQKSHLSALENQLGLETTRLATLIGKTSALPKALPNPSPPPETAAFQFASEFTAPELLAHGLKMQAQAEATRTARAAHWPTVDLAANLYLLKPTASRSALWDLLLSVQIPIYSGGQTSSTVRESILQNQVLEIERQNTLNQRSQEQDLLKQSIMGLGKQISDLIQASEMAEKSYQSHLQDFKYSQVTPLDILTAVQTSHELKRSLSRVRIQLLRDQEKYRVCTGSHPLLGGS